MFGGKYQREAFQFIWYHISIAYDKQDFMGCNIILNEMNSIESLKLDFNRQQRELGNIHNEKKFDVCIYVGSGDSYVAGLIVEHMTEHKCRCYSPSDLFNSRFNDDQTYCFYLRHW